MMIRALTICVVVSLTALALWTYSSTPTSSQIGPFSNRVILIRHGEKGPQSLVPPPVDELVHPHHAKDGPGHTPKGAGARHQKHHTGSGVQSEHTSDIDEQHDHSSVHRHPHPRGKKGQLKTRTWWPWPPRGPPSGPPGGGKGGRKFPSGLNDAGRQRAQYLRTVFGADSEFDIGMIFAAPRDLPIETERTYATVAPLASDLSLNVTIDCAETGASCVAQQVESFAKGSNKDILIVWKHRDLNVIATALGANNAKQHYPDERYDIIWIFHHGAIVEKRSMHCPDLDDGRVDRGDPDLEIEDPSSAFATIWSTLKSLWSGLLSAF